MKNRKSNLWTLTGRSSQWLGVCSIAVCFLTTGHAMAQLTWTGATSTNWNESGNWVDAVPAPGVPVNGTVLNFGGATYPTPANQPTNNDISGLTTGAINFNNNNVAAVVGPPAVVAQQTPFTLGAADLSQTITLGGNITTVISGSAPTNNTLTDTINLNLVLDASRTITTGQSGTRNHSLNILGAISEVSPGPFSLSKGGGATLSLANTANSFSGDMTITGGTVNVNSLQPAGSNSSIGKGSVINLGGTLFYYASVAGAAAVAPSGSIDRAINLTGSGGIGIEPATNFTFSGAFTNVGASNKTFTLTGNSGTHEFQGNLVNNGAGVLSVTKGSFSTWILTGNNTYTGRTEVTSGTLRVSSISDSAASNLGQGIEMKLGQGVQTGTLDYTGATGSATTRQVIIGGNNNTSINGGAAISSNGNNGSTGLRFTNPDFNLTTTDATTTRFLTLAGINTDANEVSGKIINGNTNLKTGLVKSGAGRWIVSNAASAFTGQTQVNQGVLEVKVLANAGTVSSLGAPAVASAEAVIRLGNSGDTGTLTYTGSAASATDRQIQLGSGGSNFENGGGVIRNNSNSILEFTNPVLNTPVNTGTGTNVSITTRTLTLGGTNIGNNRIAGVIADNLQTETPIVAVAKQDAGLWILEGANTYTGGTNVTGGTLSVNTIADSGTSAIGNTGTLNLGGGTISYSGASAATTARNVNLTANSTIDLLSGSLDVSDGTSGAFVLTKTGVGTLILSGLTDNNSLLLNAVGGEVHLGKGTTASIRAVAGITGIGNGATVKLIGAGTDQIFGGSATNQGVNGIVAGGMLDLNGKSESVSFLNGTGGVVDGAVTGGSGTNTFTVGEGNVSASFGGVIQNTTGTLNLKKEFAGTQTLSGSNTYTGTTAIGNGTLILTGATQATSAITSSGGGKLGLDIGSSVTAASATVTFTGRTVLVTGTPTLPSYTLLTANSIVGTPTLAAPAPAGYALQVAGNQLLLVQTDLYLAWAGAGVNFDDDANNDGVDNGLAWLLGAPNKDANATGLLPKSEKVGGGLKLTFKMLPASARSGAQLFLEHSSDLGIGDPWSVGVLVPDATGGTAPVTFSVSGTNPLDVEATVSSSEAAGGKLFSRLRAEK